MKILRCLLLLLGVFPIAPAEAAEEFALHDGDTVAFLGDSITAARSYTKIVEHYTMMRFPDRTIRFINAGVGGDTAAKGLQRLQQDVFDQRATVVLVVFGINDIGWGTKANDTTKQLYLESLRAIIEQCRARGVRPIICSCAITAELPEKAEAGYLQRMTDEGIALARSLGAETIDVQRGMREIQRKVVAANEKEPDAKKQTRMHVEDGVHLNDLGHLAMAYAMLKGLSAPAVVSSAELDAESGEVTAARGCRITQLQKSEEGLSFMREDEGLPMTVEGFGVLNFRWVPVPDGLDRYELRIAHLPAGEYEISVEGTVLGKVNAARLARGENLALLKKDPFHAGAPWDAQSQTVHDLVDAGDKLQASARLAESSLVGFASKAALRESFQAQRESLLKLTHDVARSFPYHFVIKRLHE